MPNEQFVGFPILVTLKDPAGFQVQGVVANVTGQQLSLKDVTLLWNKQTVPLYHIRSAGIADLKLLSSERAISTRDQAYPTPQAPSVGHPSPITTPHSRQASELAPTAPTASADTQIRTSKPAFVDPAILSFQKPPAKNPSVIDTAQSTHQTVQNAFSHMIGGNELSSQSRATQTPPSTSAPANFLTTATLNAPFSALNIKGGDGAVGHIPEQHMVGQDRVSIVPRSTVPQDEAFTQPSGKRNKRGNRGQLQKNATVETGDMSNLHTKATESSPASKGWRKTAFVEPAPSRHGTGRQSKRRQKRQSEEQSGWATEDATDIQELGDFDFQSNLSKFDKRRVFDQIRNDDTTADEARLVSFNRRPRPGTNGGRNLHYTENVLDPSPERNKKWNDIRETDEDEVSDHHHSVGRNSSRTRSRASIHAPPSRNSSAVFNPPAPSPQISILARGQLLSNRTSPVPTQKPPAHAASPMTGSSGSAAGSLLVSGTNRRCPTVTPLQMLEIEQLAISELGLTEDIITENAGRGIAEAAVSRSDINPSSLIHIFAGNHRTGARAISAARHLRNHNYQVVLCVLGLDRENEFSDGFRKQLDIFKKTGSKVMRWEEISVRLSAVDNMPRLVIDALFGMHISFEDLRTDDQQTAFEILSWANRSGVDILSIDIPAGLSASSGERVVVQGSHLTANSKFIVCLCAPKSGLVNALAAGEGERWKLAVADIGISEIVWKKYGTRRRHGVDFGSQWVVPLHFQASAP